MKRIRRLHAIAAILLGVAIAMVIHNQVRGAVALLCLVCLGLVASAEALRGAAAPFARKDDR